MYMGLGFFRVILAFTVIITHTHPVFGFTFGNPVIAVRTFFIISGFYMALILNEKYSHYWPFIKNRFLRIYPIYLVVLLLTIISLLGAHYIRGNWGELDYFVANISKLNPYSIVALIVSQLTILGRNLIMFSLVNPDTGWFTFHIREGFNFSAWQFLLIPQAWTLPIELLFYLIAPFVVKRKLYMVAILFFLTLLIRSSLISHGLTSTMWTYRFFPTELSYFLLGIISYKIYRIIKPNKIMMIIGFIATIFMIALLCSFNYLPRILGLDVFSVEWIYYGLITVLLPFSFIYSKKLYFDRKIGELSYPIYISHILVNNVAGPLFLSRLVPNKDYIAILVFLLCVIFSVLLLKFIQDPIEKIRARAVT